MAKSTKNTLAKNIPPAIRELLGAPPLLSTESEIVYYGTIASYAELVDPRDLIAWNLIKDLADARAEITRYRRFKCALINAPRRKQIDEQIREWKEAVVIKPKNIKAAAEKEVERVRQEARTSGKDDLEPAARANEIVQKAEKEAEQAAKAAATQVKLWRQMEVTEDDLATTYYQWITQVQTLDGLIVLAEKRFKDACDELQHHLNGLARGLWNNMEGEVIDLQPSIEPPSPRRGRPKAPPRNLDA